jgi:predicted nucleic acid-binding protein
MILVDTSVIVAWLDSGHPDHKACSTALDNCSAVEELAISSITFAELAAGGRGREALEEDLSGFKRVDLDFDSAFRGGQAFGRSQVEKGKAKRVLPDFLIRGQAASLGLPHLTNDHRRISAFPDVDFLFPESTGK